MKKTIDMSKISNDLAESSAFFRKADPPPLPSDSPPHSPASASPTPAPEKQGNKETGKQASSPPAQGAGQSGKAIPFTPEPLSGRQMTRKQTFELTKAELDFMDKAKFELRALGVTKNEMVVTGLELLAKDYYANKKKSYLYRKFASREVEETQE